MQSTDDQVQSSEKYLSPSFDLQHISQSRDLSKNLDFISGVSAFKNSGPDHW